MFKKISVSLDTFSEKLLARLMKFHKEAGDLENKSGFIRKLIIEEAKRVGLYK